MRFISHLIPVFLMNYPGYRPLDTLMATNELVQKSTIFELHDILRQMHFNPKYIFHHNLKSYR